MTNRPNIRLGIIGAGRVAEQCHIPAALSADGVDLVGIVDSSPTRLEALASSFQLSGMTATSSADLIGRVDAVLLALPNHLHYPVATQFLNAGVHVLCEKPLANTTREAHLLCDLADAAGLVLAVGYVKRFEPNCDLMKRLLDGRFLGRLDHFRFEYGTAGGWAPFSSYNLHPDQAGGGVLVTNGSHLLDRIICWFGEPSGVSYEDDSRGGVEANCRAMFTFDSGLTGELILSKTHSLQNGFRLYGEKGYIEIGHSQHKSLTHVPAGRPELKHEVSESRGREARSDIDYFRWQIEDFARAITTGLPARATGREGAASVALIERCYAAQAPLPDPVECRPACQAPPSRPARHSIDLKGVPLDDRPFGRDRLSIRECWTGGRSNAASEAGD